MTTSADTATLKQVATQLRVDSILASTAAASGHPSSSMSAADVMAVLVCRHLRYDWQHPDDPRNDHLIFSKGHASALLYSMFSAVGAISHDELLNGFRRIGSWLQGHPTPVLPWVDVAAGSLGQGPGLPSRRPLPRWPRTTRGAYPVLYDSAELFLIGGSKLLRFSADDRVTLIGAGVTLHHCLKSAGELAADGINARVLDVYSVKPINREALVQAAKQTGGRLVEVEDHYPEGGIGSAVLEALADTTQPPRVIQLAVAGLPGSGSPAEVMDVAGITTPHIVAAARRLVGTP